MFCTVDNTNPANSRRAQQRDGVDNAEGAYPQYDAEAGEQLLVVDPITATSDDSRPVPSNESDTQPQACNHSHGDDITIPTATDRPKSPVVNDSHAQNEQPKPSRHHARPSVASTSTYEAFPSNSLPLNNQPFTTPYTAGQQNTMGIDVTYSFYPFLALGNLHGIPPQDVNYLELQGCLRVPTRAILDEFVQQYFLHVHPLLPMIHEGDFWDLYCVNPTSYVPGEKLSLLVFQAMLFACCNVRYPHPISRLFRAQF